MATNFFYRLRNYFERVGAVLRGEADSASIFPNPTDIGMSRERVYAEFLRLHAPSKCNVFLGGFLFSMTGEESRQMDVIVTTDTAPRYDLHNRDGTGKAFSPVEGTLGVASIKSTLNKNELEDALHSIASIPPTESLEGRISFAVEFTGYDNWPFKIIYASNGIAGPTLLQHLNEFYAANPSIPITRRPDLIHVAGKYAILRAVPGLSIAPAFGQQVHVHVLEPGSFILIMLDSDLQGILWALNALQEYAQASAKISYEYFDLINKVNLACQ